MKAANIRVMIVDDHAAVRSSLAAVLMTFHLELVGEASDGAEAVQLCSKIHPDVILMDLSMPVMDGITATSTIKRLDPSIKIIVLTAFEDDELMLAAISAGAERFILKSISAYELAQSIKQVYTERVASWVSTPSAASALN